MALEIFVMGNADLFREALNAIASLCNSGGFKAATWCGSVLGIVMTGYAYIKKQEISVYLKWFTTFFVVVKVLLGITCTVAVVNTSDQTDTPKIVDNVPYGLAMPASLISGMGEGLSRLLETAFALPDDLQYHKTGMLFGSRLFQLSLNAQIENPEFQGEMNDYIRSCVVGDILINKKYTLNELLHSEDMWGKMIEKPSPIRGMYMDDEGQRVFKTCQQASAILDEKMDDYASSDAAANLADKLRTKQTYSNTAVSEMLGNAYGYFQLTSKESTRILKQNLIINAYRAGIKNYAAEMGSVKGMEVMENTMAMQNTRMAWATSRYLGIYNVPMTQIVLKLIIMCLFPIIMLLVLASEIGVGSLKHWLCGLIWVESWPIMFSILNMIMTFYAKSGDYGSVTLSSMNLLAQEHSDIAGMAGYFVSAIPFISIGIVFGMARAFSQLAQYIGGQLHSHAQSAASLVTSGNYSLGNISMGNTSANNLSANKHDTNFTNMHGHSTEQLDNGALVTSTPGGKDIYNVGGGMSHLATNINASQALSTSLSQGIDQSASSAFSHSTQFSHAAGNSISDGNSYSHSSSTQEDHGMSKVLRASHSYAERHGISDKDAFQHMTKIGASVGVGAGGKGGLMLNISGNLEAQNQGMSSHDGSYSHDVGNSQDIADAKEFKEGMQELESYANSHSVSDQNTESENLAIQTGADFSQINRLSEQAQFVSSHSDAINSNFNQSFADYVQTVNPMEAQAILSATGDSPLLAKQHELAEQYLKSHEQEIVQSTQAQINRPHMGLDFVTPEQRARHGADNYKSNSQLLKDRGAGLGVDKDKFSAMQSNVNKHIETNKGEIASGQSKAKQDYQSHGEAGDQMIEKGEEYAKKGVTEHALSRTENKEDPWVWKD